MTIADDDTASYSTASPAPRRVLRKSVPSAPRVDRRSQSGAAASLLEGHESTDSSPERATKPQEWWPWWWWEIGASCVSIVACGLLVLFLALIDQASRASWTFAIELNTLLAIISTVTKTSLMVPVVSCISQLKWRHFTRPHRLSHLDLIDRCSRGPWGSFVLLLELWKTNIIISALALVTIVALGVDPSVQQILETRTREAVMQNASAEVSFATSYESKALPFDQLENGGYNKDLWYLSATLYSSAHDPPQPNFSCPGDRCVWPDYTTLGVCSTVQNITSESKRNCSEVIVSNGDSVPGLLECTYSLPPLPVYEGYVYHDHDKTIFVELRNDSRANPSLVSHSFTDWRLKPSGLTTTIFEILTIEDNLADLVSGVGEDFPFPPPVELHRAEFFFCTQTVRGLRSERSRLSHDSVETERLAYADFETEIRFRMARDGYITLKDESSGKNYSYNWAGAGLLDVFLRHWLENVEVKKVSSRKDTYGTAGPFGHLILGEGLESPVQNMATTLSTMMQSKDPGDNRNATMHRGDALVDEAYFNVRWPWIAVILTEVMAVVALLITTIAMTWQDDLPKDSAFAFLVHGLHGWDDVRNPERETVRTLGHMSERMVARLEDDAHGVKKFVKQP